MPKEIIIPATEELWDPVKEEFVEPKKEVKLVLEHSLISISKWESKWMKPFLGRQEKTNEELLDYVRCMTLNPNIDKSVYDRLTVDILKEINEYIECPMTATTFNNLRTPPSREIVTSEVIYYQMIALNIPVEFQKWHLNRLMTLIRVCSIKNDPKPKKMSRREIAARNTALNAKRRAQLHTRG